MIDPHVVVVDPGNDHVVSQLAALEREARAAFEKSRRGGG